MTEKMKKWLAPAAVLLVLLAVYFSVKGMNLSGLPEYAEVLQVEITSVNKADEVVKLTEQDKIRQSVNAAGLLVYSFGKAPEETPIITIRYFLRDGTTQTLAVSQNTVSHKGKTYKLKNSSASFVQIVETVFFEQQATPQPQ